MEQKKSHTILREGCFVIKLSVRTQWLFLQSSELFFIKNTVCQLKIMFILESYHHSFKLKMMICIIGDIFTKSKFSLMENLTNEALIILTPEHMMTSSNGNIFRVTGHLCGEFTGPGEFPPQRPVTRSFDVFFDLRLNKRLSKQSCGWWFETPSRPLWRQCKAVVSFLMPQGIFCLR